MQRALTREESRCGPRAASDHVMSSQRLSLWACISAPRRVRVGPHGARVAAGVVGCAHLHLQPRHEDTAPPAP